MCGIAGEFRYQATTDLADWGQISQLMERRGPDAVGHWSDGQHCTLAFRRLAILDLSPAGHQPMLTPDRNFALIYNGELYNFRELRTELERLGVRFHSSGDTEVVLYALIYWGKAALQRFNGMFALAFYDVRGRRLLLARDHAGIKPLYVLRRPEGLFFASQYDQILAHPWSAGLPVDQGGLVLYLHLGYIPAPHAILRSTAMLEPGSWLELESKGEVSTGQYFSFPRNPQPDLAGADAAAAVDAAVTAAVRRQMISDVPLGAFLSGGIDSPLVVAKMRAASPQVPRAFTIAVDDPTLDESSEASTYARALGIEHIVKQVTTDQLTDLLNDVVAACGEPFADYSIFPTMLVARLARRSVTVMLSGDGGDELFWGYVGRFGSVLQQTSGFRHPALLRSVRWGAKKYLNLGTATQNLLRPSIGAWYQAKHSRIPHHWLQQIFPDLPAWPANNDLFNYNGFDPDETAGWLRWNEFVGHLTCVLLKVDRASMYHSLEVRVPLLDRDVLDVATRVHWRSCLDLQQNLGKLPLRQSLARHTSFQTQVKRGFAVPIGSWLRGPFRTMFEDLVLARKELLGLPLQSDALRTLFATHQSGSADYGWALWVLLSLALWEERHLSARSRPAVVRAEAPAVS